MDDKIKGAWAIEAPGRTGMSWLALDAAHELAWMDDPDFGKCLPVVLGDLEWERIHAQAKPFPKVMWDTIKDLTEGVEVDLDAALPDEFEDGVPGLESIGGTTIPNSHPVRMDDDLWEMMLADERALDDDHPGMDETEYLMQGANGERMMRALAQLNAGQGRDEHGNPVTWHTGFPDVQAMDAQQLDFGPQGIPPQVVDMVEMLDADDYGLNDDQVTLFDKDGNPESPAFHRGYSHGMKRISEIMDTPHYQRIQEMYFREFLTPQERDSARQDLIENIAKAKAAMEPYSRGLHPRVAAIRAALSNEQDGQS